MNPELRAAVEEMRRQVEESAAETRRHFDVVAEGLRGSIQMLAEGITGCPNASIAWKSISAKRSCGPSES